MAHAHAELCMYPHHTFKPAAVIPITQPAVLQQAMSTIQGAGTRDHGSEAWPSLTPMALAARHVRR